MKPPRSTPAVDNAAAWRIAKLRQARGTGICRLKFAACCQRFPHGRIRCASNLYRTLGDSFISARETDLCDDSLQNPAHVGLQHIGLEQHNDEQHGLQCDYGTYTE